MIDFVGMVCCQSTLAEADTVLGALSLFPSSRVDGMVDTVTGAVGEMTTVLFATGCSRR
jgi:hypothetical protein